MKVKAKKNYHNNKNNSNNNSNTNSNDDSIPYAFRQSFAILQKKQQKKKYHNNTTTMNDNNNNNNNTNQNFNNNMNRKKTLKIQPKERLSAYAERVDRECNEALRKAIMDGSEFGRRRKEK